MQTQVHSLFSSSERDKRISSAGQLRYFLLSAFFILSISISAQSPQGFNYQAVARNSAGQELVNQSVSVRFRITDATASSFLYEEIHNTTTNAFGLINLVVGTGTSQPSSTVAFSAIPWGTNSPYSMQVEINVQSSGWVNMGTTVLWSVPYALYAANGPIGPTGATGPTGLAGTNGTNGSTGPTGLTGSAGTNGTNGSTGATGPTGQAGTNGTNGSTGPTGPTGPKGDTGVAGINGTPGINGADGATGATGSIGPTGPKGDTGFVASGSQAGVTPFWNGTNWITNSTNLFNNGGNIGIGGIITPQSLLHLHNPSSVRTKLQVTNGAVGPLTDSSGLNMGVDAFGRAFIYQGDNRSMLFYTNSTPRMQISPNGFVGINTAIPLSLLNITAPIGSNGYSLINSFSSTDTVGYALLNSSTSYAMWLTGSTLQFANGRIPMMTFIPSGFAGLGTSSPQSLLHLNKSAASPAQLLFTSSTASNGFQMGNGSGTDFLFNQRDASEVFFQYNSNNIIRYGANGVGIRTTTTPANALEVNGNIKVDNGSITLQGPTNNVRYQPGIQRVYSISPADGRSAEPVSYQTVINISPNVYTNIGNGVNNTTPGQILFPVHLPDSAVINSIIMFCYDNVAARSISFSLVKMAQTSGLSTTIYSSPTTITNSTTVQQWPTTAPVLNEVIDNQSNTYMIIFNTFQQNPNLRLYSFRINYTVYRAE